MRFVLLLLCSLGLMPLARAESIASMQKRTEASMLVTGSVDIAPDGALAAIILDHPELLPANVKAVISRASAHWRFAPDPAEDASTRRVPVSLRIVARTESDGVYRSRIRGATFGALVTGEQLRVKSRKLPVYPVQPVFRISADVYLLVRIDAHGDVTDVSADQVNLDTMADEQIMRQFRRQFADASVRAVRQWKYEVLQPGSAGDGAWFIRMPIHFGVLDHPGDIHPYGQWSIYVPGPLESVAWLEKYGLNQPAGNADAMPDGQLQLMQSQVALVTPLDDG